MPLPNEVNGYEKREFESHEGNDVLSYEKEHGQSGYTQVSFVRERDGYKVRIISGKSVPGPNRGAGPEEQKKLGPFPSKKEAESAALSWMKENPKGLEVQSRATSSGSSMGFGFGNTNGGFGDPFGVGNGGNGNANGEDEDNQDPFNWFM